MLDIAVAYNRYKFFGHEFLTWLWYVIENDRKILSDVDKNMDSLAVGNRMVLENGRGNAPESITSKGDEAGLEEGLVALRKGAVVTELNLIYRTDNREWRFNIKGESLNVSGLKIPEDAVPENTENVDEKLLNTLALQEKVLVLTSALYGRFVRIRLSKEWETRTASRIRKWISA
jgi:hypothetical protein